jgi:hypothetical protein
VKRKIVAIPLLAATLVFIIAYTTIEKGNSPHTAAAVKEKKEVPVSKKSKTPKKKIKAKSLSTTAKKDEEKETEETETNNAQTSVYDLKKNTIIYSGLVAHGSCNETFMARPKFSNQSKSGCSSLGKYQVCEFYTGKYGKSYRLTGLDNTNSNAYNRAVVIHGYDCVPDEEIYPRVLCNSLGCIMVSYKFFNKLSGLINKSGKPILLWVYQ